MDHSDIDRLMKAACDFQAQSQQARELCRDQYRNKETNEDNSIRILIDGQIAYLATKTTEKIPQTSPEISYQIVASASIIRTHFVISDMILNGDLVEAATLIRKQLEAVSRLLELDAAPIEKLLGKTPNIGMVLKRGTGRIYGILSEVAHSATPDIAEYLHVVESGDQIGPSLMPRFTDKSRLCCDINSFLALYFLAWFIQKLSNWYPTYDNSNDMEVLTYTYMLAKEVDLIRFHE